MPGENTPATAGNQPAQGQQPGAGGNAQQLVSQGPNDPINPATNAGGQQPTQGAAGAGQGAGTTEQPADGDVETRLTRMEAHMRRMGEERDEARRLLEEEKRKALPPEEQTRLKALDEQVKVQQAREKNLILRYEIASRAPRLGIVDPELAVLLLERNTTVAVGDDGKVTGLDEALKDLIKERPHLVRATTQPIDGGAGSGGARTGAKAGMNDIIRGAARGKSISQG